MYRPKRSKDFFTDFSCSYFMSFLSLFSGKTKQITTFYTKLIIDFGHHYEISGKSDRMTHSEKNKKKTRNHM